VFESSILGHIDGPSSADPDGEFRIRFLYETFGTLHALDVGSAYLEDVYAVSSILQLVLQSLAGDLSGDGIADQDAVPPELQVFYSLSGTAENIMTDMNAPGEKYRECLVKNRSTTEAGSVI